MKKSHATDLTRGPIGWGLLRFTAPLFFGQLLQQMYNTVDAWVLGNFESAQGLAAVTATEGTIRLIISLVSGFAVGGSVIISRYFGEKNRRGDRVRLKIRFQAYCRPGYRQYAGIFGKQNVI